MIEENKQKKLTIKNAAEKKKSLADANKSSIEEPDTVKKTYGGQPVASSKSPHQLK